MSPLRVDLGYFAGCPHVDAARRAIRSALSAEGLETGWSEWDCDDTRTPGPLRRYGSPTVLVNGRDVVPAPADGNCCRVYTEEAGWRHAPSVAAIRSALGLARRDDGAA